MNENLSTVEGRSVLRVERRLAHPPEKVLARLDRTRPPQRVVPRRHGDGKLTVGGKISFIFRNVSDLDGVVTDQDPPRVLAYTWGDSLLRWELSPEGEGCLLTLVQTFDDRPAAASFGAGWNLCLDGILAALTGGPAGEPADWAALHEDFVASFGLDEGTGELTGDGWRVRFERQLTRPVDAAWAALRDAGTGPSTGDPAPPAFTHPAMIDAGAVTALDGAHAARVRVAARRPPRRPGPLAAGGRQRRRPPHPDPDRTRRGGAERATALTAWRTRIEQLAGSAEHRPMRGRLSRRRSSASTAAGSRCGGLAGHHTPDSSRKGYQRPSLPSRSCRPCPRTVHRLREPSSWGDSSRSHAAASAARARASSRLAGVHALSRTSSPAGPPYSQARTARSGHDRARRDRPAPDPSPAAWPQPWGGRPDVPMCRGQPHGVLPLVQVGRRRTGGEELDEPEHRPRPPRAAAVRPGRHRARPASPAADRRAPGREPRAAAAAQAAARPVGGPAPARRAAPPSAARCGAATPPAAPAHRVRGAAAARTGLVLQPRRLVAQRGRVPARMLPAGTVTAWFEVGGRRASARTPASSTAPTRSAGSSRSSSAASDRPAPSTWSRNRSHSTADSCSTRDDRVMRRVGHIEDRRREPPRAHGDLNPRDRQGDRGLCRSGSESSEMSSAAATHAWPHQGPREPAAPAPRRERRETEDPVGLAHHRPSRS